MTDGIIKGIGNSRFMKIPANGMSLYPTHEDLIQAMVNGEFAFDLNGLNSTGWDRLSTLLGKASLLSDSTEQSIWGSAADRTVDQALYQLRSLVSSAQSSAYSAISTANSRARFLFGSYTGDGMGSEVEEPNNKFISVGVAPKAVIIAATSGFQNGMQREIVSALFSPSCPARIINGSVTQDVAWVSGNGFYVSAFSGKYINHYAYYCYLNSGTNYYLVLY